MATKIPRLVVPSDLRYDQAEVLDGGALFYRFDTLAELKAFWAHKRAELPFACLGTGFMHPARFLDRHEWIFSPSKQALVKAVVRWDEFGVAPRWYDLMSDERPVRIEFQRRRAARRDLGLALGTWSPQDETAYLSNVHPVRDAMRRGFWRLANLPCGLTHFDWFSEHARMPNNPNLPRDQVEVVLQRMSFEDWQAHQTLQDVDMLDAVGVDAEIAYWELERAEGRDPYEDGED